MNFILDRLRYVITEQQFEVIDKFGIELDSILYDVAIDGKNVPEISLKFLYPETMCYAKRYQDLFEAYCSSKMESCAPKDLHYHWLTSGKIEGDDLHGKLMLMVRSMVRVY